MYNVHMNSLYFLSLSIYILEHYYVWNAKRYRKGPVNNARRIHPEGSFLHTGWTGRKISISVTRDRIPFGGYNVLERHKCFYSRFFCIDWYVTVKYLVVRVPIFFLRGGGCLGRHPPFLLCVRNFETWAPLLALYLKESIHSWELSLALLEIGAVASFIKI